MQHAQEFEVYSVWELADRAFPTETCRHLAHSGELKQARRDLACVEASLEHKNPDLEAAMACPQTHLCTYVPTEADLSEVHHARSRVKCLEALCIAEIAYICDKAAQFILDKRLAISYSDAEGTFEVIEAGEFDILETTLGCMHVALKPPYAYGMEVQRFYITNPVIRVRPRRAHGFELVARSN